MQIHIACLYMYTGHGNRTIAKARVGRMGPFAIASSC